MAERILILGASARAAAQSAAKAGYSVIAADLFADVDLQSTAESTRRVVEYPHEFESILRSTSYDHWMVTGALENYAELLARWINTFPGYRGCSAESIARVRTTAWREMLVEKGF